MEILSLIDDIIDEFISMVAQAEIFLQQSFNMAQFKIDGSASAPFGYYLGRA